MPTAIVLTGPSSVGKTTTVRMVYEHLREAFPDATYDEVRDNGGDIRAVITIDGFVIGIESQGDPWKKATRLDPALRLFVKRRCDVILCATRTWGGTYDAALALENHGYTVIFRPRRRETGERNQARSNRTEARWVIGQVEELMGVGAA